MFFTHQTLSIFIRLSVPWDPNLDPCGKSVVLAGARKINIKVVCVSLPIRHFPFSFLWLSLGIPIWILAAKVWSYQARAKKNIKSHLCFSPIMHFLFSLICLSLGVPTWILAAKVWSWQALANFTYKSFMFFYPSYTFHYHSFGCPLGSQLGSLLQKCDPDRRTQNSHKSRLCFFTHQTFPIFIPLDVPWGPNLDPCGKSVILTGARKIHIKVVYVFLPIIHFPFSFVCMFLGIPTWILAARVWSWQARAKFI